MIAGALSFQVGHSNMEAAAYNTKLAFLTRSLLWQQTCSQSDCIETQGLPGCWAGHTSESIPSEPVPDGSERRLALALTSSPVREVPSSRSSPASLAESDWESSRLQQSPRRRCQRVSMATGYIYAQLMQRLGVEPVAIPVLAACLSECTLDRHALQEQYRASYNLQI